MILSFMRSVNERERTIWQFVIAKNKLTSVFHASVLLLTMDFVITLSICQVDWEDLSNTQDSVRPHYQTPKLVKNTLQVVFSTLLDVWKCGESRSFVFHVWHKRAYGFDSGPVLYINVAWVCYWFFPCSEGFSSGSNFPTVFRPGKPAQPG